MKRVILYLFLASVLLFLVLFLLSRGKRNNEQQLITKPKLLSSNGEVLVKSENRKILVKTGSGDVEILKNGSYFLIHDNTDVNFLVEGVKFEKGRIEYKGKSIIKTGFGTLSFAGEGFVFDKGVCVLKGEAEVGRISLREGECFSAGEKMKVSISKPDFSVSNGHLTVNSSGNFSVEISRNPLFSENFFTGEINGFKKFVLKNGVYYLRKCLYFPLYVCSEPEVFKVKDLKKELAKIDETPPFLDVTITPKGRVVIITGKTEIGVKIYVNGKLVRADSYGNFYSTLYYNKSGVKTVVIEAVDSAGNMTKKQKEVVIYGD